MCLFSVLDKIKIALMAISDPKNRILALNVGSCVCRKYFMASPSSWAKQIYRLLAAEPQACEEI